MKNMMIFKRFLLLASAAIIAVSFNACGDDTEPDSAGDMYISLSGDEFTFDAEGLQTFVVTVTAEPPLMTWRVENDSEWLSHEVYGNKITFTAEPNETGEELTATVRVVAGKVSHPISFTQLRDKSEDDMKLERLMKMDDFYDVVMSPNGRYVGVVLETLTDNTWYFTIMIYDATTGEWTECETTRETYARPTNISDGGFLVVFEEMFDSGCYYSADGTRHDLALPAGDWSSPLPEGISEDGSVVVGTVSSTTEWKRVPAKWTNGVAELLPYPDPLPETEMPWGNVYPRGCSADGSIIYGNGEATMSIYLPIIWYPDGTVEVAAIDEADYEATHYSDEYSNYWELAWKEGVLMDAELFNMSPDGKLLACTFYEGDNSREPGIPCIYNTETRTLEKSDVSGYYGWSVSDDELLVAISSINAPDGGGYVIDMNTNASMTAQQWFTAECGLSTGFQIRIERIGENGAAIGSYVDEAGVSKVKKFWYLKPRDAK